MKKGSKHSPEVIARMVDAHRGKTHSPEVRAKMSAAHRGRRASPQAREHMRKERNHAWKGGKVITSHGYVSALRPDHLRADSRGYIYEHRLVMEKRLGRFLAPEELVHHINGNKQDNRDENLKLFPTRGDHVRFHDAKRNRTEIIIEDI